jgi:hypothetical protein
MEQRHEDVQHDYLRMLLDLFAVRLGRVVARGNGDAGRRCCKATATQTTMMLHRHHLSSYYYNSLWLVCFLMELMMILLFVAADDGDGTAVAVAYSTACRLAAPCGPEVSQVRNLL